MLIKGFGNKLDPFELASQTMPSLFRSQNQISYLLIRVLLCSIKCIDDFCGKKERK